MKTCRCRNVWARVDLGFRGCLLTNSNSRECRGPCKSGTNKDAYILISTRDAELTCLRDGVDRSLFLLGPRSRPRLLRLHCLQSRFFVFVILRLASFWNLQLHRHLDGARGISWNLGLYPAGLVRLLRGIWQPLSVWGTLPSVQIWGLTKQM